jgi:hypothetical protein
MPLMTSSPSQKIDAERSPADLRRPNRAMMGLATGPEVRFFDESLDALQQEAVSRALGTIELLLIEASDRKRREAVLAELLRQMAFRGVTALVLRAADCTQAAELNGHSECLNNARAQWNNLLKLAGQTTSMSREGDLAGHGAKNGHGGRPSWWVRATNWLRSRGPSVTSREPSSVTLRDIEEAWAISCERLTGTRITPPSLDAVSEWHRHICSTETADIVDATCHEAANQGFDVVILLCDESLDDGMIPRLAAKGRRLVIFGALPAKSPSDISTRALQDAPEDTAAFGRLWRSMQHSPFGAEYRWVEHAGHISCRLDDYPYDSTYVERERVADRPDIELRIDAPPHGSPRLIEIVFPRGHGIQECKQFAHRELEQPAMDATGKRMHWNEAAAHISVGLSPVSSQRHCFVEIAPGVRERVCFAHREPAQANAGRWITERLEFDRSHGWDRAKVEAWLRVQCGFWNDERTLSLEQVDSLTTASTSESLQSVE